MSYKDAWEAADERSEKYYDALKRIRQCMPPLFPYEGWEKDHKTLKDWQLYTHRRTCMDIADILEEIDV